MIYVGITSAFHNALSVPRINFGQLDIWREDRCVVAKHRYTTTILRCEKPQKYRDLKKVYSLIVTIFEMQNVKLECYLRAESCVMEIDPFPASSALFFVVI